MREHFCQRSSPLGPVAVCWSMNQRRPIIHSIRLPRSGGSVTADAGVSCRTIDRLADRLAAFLNGEKVRFVLDMLDLDQCTPFQRKVLMAAYRIPYGRVSSYKALAVAIGNPLASRAVGMVMAVNPFPLVIPCHRVIGSDNSLGGFQNGLKMKRELLEQEGVRFDRSGRVIQI